MLSVNKRFVILLGMLMLILVTADTADAQTRSRTRQKRTNLQSSQKQSKRQVTVPVDIGVGPTFNTLGAIDFANFGLAGPIYEDQTFHYGIRISLEAVLDQQFLRENSRLVPRQYRSHVRQMTEIRFKPGIASLIPTSLLISPKINNTGVYGATWSFLGLGIAPISGPIRLGINGNIIATYAFIYSDTVASPTHFLRPGAELSIDLEIPVTDQFLLSLGWASQFYIPQQVGGSVFDLGSGNDALWHIGQAFFMFHFRVPYTTSL